MNTINDTSTNGTITGTGTACNYTNSCAYKLPCGLCRLLMSQCPKDTSYPNITWTTIAQQQNTITNPTTGTTTAVMNNE